VNLLFLGDIVGQPGRRAVRELLPRLRAEHAVSVVVANGENSAGGSGITPKTAEEIFAAGVDVITSGDHLWDQKEVTGLLESEPRFLRPLNYPPGTPGQGGRVFRLDGQPPFAVVNVQGRVFMAALEDPFRLLQSEIPRLRRETPVILVDVHAEATSEKIALARMLDGQVSAVIGTHTHVQTADARVLTGGTAFMTDVGMCGPWDSVIGVKKELVLERFLSQRPVQFEPARRDVWLQGAIVDIDDSTGKARSIERVQEKDEEQ